VNYLVRPTQVSSAGQPDWNAPTWAVAETLEIENFRSEGSSHRPQTSARLLYDAHGIHGIFSVRDRFVRCIRTNYMDQVWKDSCVEFFVQPKADKGYFNFEFNCGGAFLCCYITDPARAPEGFKSFVRVPKSVAEKVRCNATLPKRVDPEVQEPVNWSLQFFIPFVMLEEFVGPIGPVAGQTWRGNFFKCADESSHPHWASWAPVDELNFHLPRCFGNLQFSPK
jgi:hypothetical protein